MSLQLAEQYEDNEMYAQAYEEYQRLHEQNPKDLSILERLGHLAMLLDKRTEAADYYSQILELDATNALAYEQLMDIYVTTDRYKYYIYRGNLHISLQQLDHATNDYRKAVSCAENEKDISTSRFVLGTLYEAQKNNLKAIDEYLKVIEYENIPQEVYLKLANLYIVEDARLSAIDILERAIKSGVDTTEVKESLADLYLKNGNAEKALETTSDELTKTKALLELDRKTEAFEKLNQLESQYDHIGQFHALKAQYYYMIGELDKSLECVNEFEKIESNSPLIYQMRALIFEDKNDDYNAHLNWGKYNLVRGNKDVAINEFLNAYQLKGDDLNLLNTLAVLLEEGGDTNHAMEIYEKITKLDETDKKALIKLADFRESIGDYRMQSEYLLQLYRADKRNFDVVKKLGEVYEKLHNKPAAIECYEKFLEIGYSSSEYENIKNRLEKLKNTGTAEEEGLLDKILSWFNKK